MEALPESEVLILQRLISSGDYKGLKARVALLRQKGWSVRQIAPAAGVSRTTVSNWGSTPVDPYAQSVLSHRVIASAGVKTVKWYARIPRYDVEEMQKLAVGAKKVTSASSKDSENYQDGLFLDNFIQHYLDNLVPVTEIAKILGITHRAVRARLERRHDN